MYTIISCDLLSLLLQSEPTRWISVMLTMHTTNVQVWMVLNGIYHPTSAWLDTGWVQTVDLSPNIDLESRSGASTLETQVCYNCAPKATVRHLATKGQRVATYDPRWLQRVN